MITNAGDYICEPTRCLRNTKHVFYRKSWLTFLKVNEFATPDCGHNDLMIKLNH